MTMKKYLLEFVLIAKNNEGGNIKISLNECGDNLEIFPLDAVAGNIRDYKIRINTDDPTLVFDACAQIGRLKSVKID